MKILVLADVESKYLWDYFEKEKLEGIDLILQGLFNDKLYKNQYSNIYLSYPLIIVVLLYCSSLWNSLE